MKEALRSLQSGLGLFSKSVQELSEIASHSVNDEKSSKALNEKFELLQLGFEALASLPSGEEDRDVEEEQEMLSGDSVDGLDLSLKDALRMT